MSDARNRATSSTITLETDQFKQLVVLTQGASFQEAVLDGRVFSAANATKVAQTAGITATWTGLGIANPAASGKNLIIHEFGYALMIASDVAGLIGLMTAPLGDMADNLTKYNALDGGSVASSVAYADDGATLGTPVLKRILSSAGTEAMDTNLFPAAPQIYYPEGSLIIPPGRAVATYFTLASTACFVFHFVWEEIDE